jgi:hypothetical protein
MQEFLAVLLLTDFPWRLPKGNQQALIAIRDPCFCVFYLPFPIFHFHNRVWVGRFAAPRQAFVFFFSGFDSSISVLHLSTIQSRAVVTRGANLPVNSSLMVFPVLFHQ